MLLFFFKNTKIAADFMLCGFEAAKRCTLSCRALFFNIPDLDAYHFNNYI